MRRACVLTMLSAWLLGASLAHGAGKPGYPTQIAWSGPRFTFTQ